jgi:iron complex outermembrane receptor protein
LKSWRRLERLRSGLGGLLLGVVGVAAAAEPVAPAKIDVTEVSLEQLMYNFEVQPVYGASKHEQRSSEAPSSVSIVDAEEIQRYGHRNLAEVLASVRGLYVSYDRNYSYLGVRGFNRPGDYTSRVLVLVNGHRVNDNVLDSVLLGNEFILDVDTIDRIEVIRGPSSSLYGNNAFFGVVNVITKTGRSLNGPEFSVSYGSFDATTVRASYGKQFTNGVQMYWTGTFYDSAGQDELYYREYDRPTNNVNGGITRHTDYERAYKTFVTLSYQDFTLDGGYSTRLKGIPTGSYGTLYGDDDAWTTDARAFAVLKYQKKLTDEWDLLARLSYDHYDYHGSYPYLFDPGGRDQTDDYALGNWWGGELLVTRRLFDRHTISVGTEFKDNFQQDQGVEDPTVTYDDERESFNYAFYGQAEISVLTNLLLNAGIRYDYYETFGDTVNPRLAAIYSPLSDTTVKLLYGTAYRAPNSYELYYSAPEANKGNPDLDPETITTYEAVIEQRLNRHLRFTATGFYYDIDDPITQVTDPADDLLVYQNQDHAIAYGAEVELDGRFAGGLRGRISYTWQQTEDQATGRELVNSPQHLVKLNVIVPVWRDKVFSGFELQYNGPTQTLAGNQADGFVVANFTVFSRELVRGLEASAGVYNLFNTTYSYPAAGEHLQDTIEQDGRTFRVKLTYRF